MSSMNLSREQQNELLFIGFNQDYGCFACGTDSGFRIYNCDPFKETFRRDFKSGGIGIVEMLFRCNILAIVGGGRNPRYPPNKVMIWDDHQNRSIGELSFRSEVKAVKLRRDRIIVILQTKIYMYNFADLKLLDQIETIGNPKGLCSLCPNSSNLVLACPGVSRGTVRIELYDSRKTTLIPAHEAELAQICLNLEGTKVATASDKGTLIRVFDTKSGQLLQELRRGADKAEIYSICFSPNSLFIACSSDKGTVHIFSLSSKEISEGIVDSEVQGDPAISLSNSISFMKGLLPKYFSSEWSFAQFRIPETRTICAFGAESNTIYVIGADGTFYSAIFDTNGECQKTSFAKLIQSEEEDE